MYNIIFLQDPKKAKLFFVPFDITHNTWECSIKNYSDIFPNERVKFIVSYLKSSLYFSRLKGKDHFSIEDDSPFFSWKHDITSWRYFNSFCKECILITPDNTASLRDKFGHLISVDRLISSPHPAAYHYIENIDNQKSKSVVPWNMNKQHDSVITAVVGTVKKVK
jgi:hypothetical protein